MSCSQYAVGDTRRFEMGTPAQVWSTMSRCWTVAPTSARIIEDIDALPGVLEKIIAANGCVVHDEFLRTGRRAVSRDGARLTRNARSRQRIETCRACPRHPDIEAALTELRANLQGAQCASARRFALNCDVLFAEMSWTTLPDGLQMRRLAGELAARAARCRSFNGCFPRKKSKIWYMPRAQIRPCGGGTTWKGARQHSVRELLSRRVVPKSQAATSRTRAPEARARGCSRGAVCIGRADRKSGGSSLWN